MFSRPDRMSSMTCFLASAQQVPELLISCVYVMQLQLCAPGSMHAHTYVRSVTCCR